MPLNSKIATLILISCIGFCTFGQSLAEKYQYYITKESLNEHLSIIASDSLQGRATGTIGQDKAADYIAAHFQLNGLIPAHGATDYFQAFSVVELNPSLSLVIGNDTLTYGTDLFANFQPAVFSLLQKEILFFDLSIEIEKHDLTNKLVVFFDETSPYFSVETVKNQYKKAVKQGAIGVIYVTPYFDAVIKGQGNRLYRKKYAFLSEWTSEGGIPLIFGNASSFKDKLENIPLSKRKQKHKEIIQADVYINQDTTHLKGKNVVAWLPAIDTTIRETLVLIAHYDHLGIINGEVFNGADDNGTGTAAILQIAKAFSIAKADQVAPKKNILFLAVSAEEIGLLGSRYFTENPLIPLNDITTVLNVDMIGRVDELHTDPNYVYVIGSDFLSEELHHKNEQANTYIGLNLDYTYNDVNHPDRLYFRSDHYNFAQYGIPSIFYFGGFHEDYHTATDTIEKINFEKVEKITRLIFFTAWEVVNH